MSYHLSNRDGRVHGEVSALLPWYVNGTISELDRQRVDAHLPACADCSNDLAREQYVYRSMTADTAVEYMPAASLKRLMTRLDGIAAPAAADAAADAGPKPMRRRHAIPWMGLMAASIAVMAVAVSLLTADRWLYSRPSGSQPNYYTVTTALPRPRGEVIRAVFSPTITLDELQGILDEAQLRIVSGPTEAGVYSLAAKSNRPVSSSLALLRGHAKVRFAESTPESTPQGTQIATGSGYSP
jgi:Putative zinc-finger